MRVNGDPAMLRKISSSSTQTTGATAPGDTITEETSQTSDTSSQPQPASLMEHDQREGV